MSTDFRFYFAVAAAAGLLMFASQAPAQEGTPAAQATSSSGDDDWAPPSDSDAQEPPANAVVSVAAPRLRTLRSMRAGQSQGPVAMATRVRFDDLDLRTPHGASALRARLRSAAVDVCEQLAAAYPVYQMRLTSCERTALNNANVRANRLIRNAGGVQNP